MRDRRGPGRKLPAELWCSSCQGWFRHRLPGQERVRDVDQLRRLVATALALHHAHDDDCPASWARLFERWNLELSSGPGEVDL